MPPSPLSLSVNALVLTALVGGAGPGRAAADPGLRTDDTGRAASATSDLTPTAAANAETVERLLAGVEPAGGRIDRQPPGSDERIESMEELLDLRIDGIETRTRTVTKPIEHDVVTLEDDDLEIGVDQIAVEGQAGVRTRTLERIIVNGKPSSWQLVANEITTEPVTELVLVGTKEPEPEPEPEPELAEPTDAEPAAAPAPTSSTSSGVWDQLAQCESGGNWSINTGNGYSGGLQFLPSTWQAYGGSGLPHENSRDEQIRVASNLRDAEGGYGAWPTCAAKLGLPR